MFEDWTLKSLEKLLYVAEMQTLSKNEHIFNQGDKANGFYIVFKGDVLITHKIIKKYKEKLYFDKDELNPQEKMETSNEHEKSTDSKNIAKTNDQASKSFTQYRQAFHTVVGIPIVIP